MNKIVSCYFELAARWYVFLMLSIYGMGKLLGGQFYRKGNLPQEIGQLPLNEVGGFDLAWSFMGYSYAYILFIGVSQLLGALLLLFNRTKLMGAAILVPILVNIIAFDAIFFDTYGALASACLYFLLLLYVLYFNRNKLRKAIRVITTIDPAVIQLNRETIKTIGIIGLLIALFFGIDQFFVNLLGH